MAGRCHKSEIELAIVKSALERLRTFHFKAEYLRSKMVEEKVSLLI